MTLNLLFDGVHDPHSAIVSQHLKIGSCPYCEDVMMSSNIGLVSGKMLSDQVLVYYTVILSLKTNPSTYERI